MFVYGFGRRARQQVACRIATCIAASPRCHPVQSTSFPYGSPRITYLPGFHAPLEKSQSIPWTIEPGNGGRESPRRSSSLERRKFPVALTSLIVIDRRSTASPQIRENDQLAISFAICDLFRGFWIDFLELRSSSNISLINHFLNATFDASFGKMANLWFLLQVSRILKNRFFKIYE